MKLNLNIATRHNYVYLIYLAKFGKSKKKIFKFGKTHNVLQRFRGYSKNSTLVFLCRVKDCHHVEDEIHKIFKMYFEHQGDRGREYFMGDGKTMIDYINQIIDHMGQRVDDELIDKVKHGYRNHLKFNLQNTVENIPDTFGDNLIESYANDTNVYTKKDVPIKDSYSKEKKPIVKKSENNEKLVIKGDIEKIVKTPLINDDQKEEILKKENRTEEDNLKLEKIKLRDGFSFKQDVDDDKLNDCIKSYKEHDDTINRLFEYYVKSKSTEKQNEEKISDDRKKQYILFSVFKRAVARLNFNVNFENGNVDKVIYFKKDAFEEMLKEINFSDEDVKALKTRGKANDKYNILKIVMSRFGIKLTKKYEKIRIKKTKASKKVLIGYNVNYIKEIYDVLRCRIHYEKKKFSKNFLAFIGKFKTYDDYLDKESEKYVFNQPRLFFG